jgi:peptidoglycan/xylan/chitin deacetylase (PgdA/CDA1 family)
MEIRTDQVNYMQGNLTIVMYHYVRDLLNSRYPEIKGLDIKRFENQIEYILKHYEVITTEEVIDYIDKGRALPPKALILTFDDGYLEHYTNVFPILSNYGIQGSFYVPAKAVEEHALLDVNKIHFILASTPDKKSIVYDLDMLIQKYKETYELQTFDYYYKKLAVASRYDTEDVIFIKRLLQVELIEELRLKMVDELFLKYVGIEESIFAKELYMSKNQLIHMRKSGMHIGSHGYNHYWWNHLKQEDLTIEIDKSMIFLAEIGVDMSNWTACYPYGSFDKQAVKMLKNKGCKLAMTTEVDIAIPTKDNRFLLPRLDTNDLPKEKNASVNKWYEKGF